MVTVCCYADKMPVKTTLGFLGEATYPPWMAKLFREQKDSGLGAAQHPVKHQALSIHHYDA